ncbi:hypothetical protein Pla123a_43390 [Posidoniimonas polymericola]|uniref:Uncharacterized protein n=1 Tax=Posidoniimonas polymericola TaxID=2528002 RepID=A0A5C5XWI9_9BACT|nr:hypothetical protein [Posidoniimonas polymericola]TWT66911.1 hypothetical protein Pla123a_43390 [Posidoniimonas polymericola]
MSPRRFLIAFTATVTAAFLAVSALNWGIDPYDQYGPHGLPPLTLTSRGAKSTAIAQAAGAARGLVLGSSRVLKVSPEQLESLTGARFYNAGVYYGRPEDFLALVRRYGSVNGRPPSELVIGLDVDAFADRVGPDPELLRVPELRSEVPECVTLSDRWQPVRELLSWRQTTGSLRLLYATARHRAPENEEFFAPDGSIVYAERDQRLAEGDYNWGTAFNYDRQVYLGLYQGYDRLSLMRMLAWRDLMDYCESHAVRLTVFLTPVHPKLLDELRGVEHYERRRADVFALLDCTLPPRGRFLDLTEVASFRGDPEAFYDAVHLRSANASRLVETLFSGGEAERYAVQ